MASRRNEVKARQSEAKLARQREAKARQSEAKLARQSEAKARQSEAKLARQNFLPRAIGEEERRAEQRRTDT